MFPPAPVSVQEVKTATVRFGSSMSVRPLARKRQRCARVQGILERRAYQEEGSL